MNPQLLLYLHWKRTKERVRYKFKEGYRKQIKHNLFAVDFERKNKKK